MLLVMVLPHALDGLIKSAEPMVFSMTFEVLPFNQLVVNTINRLLHRMTHNNV